VTPYARGVHQRGHIQIIKGKVHEQIYKLG
jgi:hypothetical protein